MIHQVIPSPAQLLRDRLQPEKVVDLTGWDRTWTSDNYARAATLHSNGLMPPAIVWFESQTSPFSPPDQITDDLVIVTAGNANFRPIVLKQLQNAEVLGHRTVVYDLGGLGLGLSRPVESKAFHKEGRYCKLVNGWTSKGLHKPGIIADCLARMTNENSVLVYLDADAVPVRSLDSLKAMPFDVAVVYRPLAERKAAGYSYSAEIGQVNAGVLMFRPTAAAKSFLQLWSKMTINCSGDQLALNRMLPKKLVENETRVEGYRLKVLAAHFNCSYCPSLGNPNLAEATIVHFKTKSWSAFGKIAHRKALFIPDHRRRAVTQQFPHIGSLANDLMLAVLNQKAAVVSLGGIDTLLAEGWELKKIWVDDKCAPTLLFVNPSLNDKHQ